MVLLGVYDGHGGKGAADYIAKHIGTVLKNQCTLTIEDYNQQEFSTDRCEKVYLRDNQFLRISRQRP